MRELGDGGGAGQGIAAKRDVQNSIRTSVN
jgi:hypothetical protein